MAYILRIRCAANGTPTPVDGQFIVEYDPTRTGINKAGRRVLAHLVLGADPAKARQFPDQIEALEYWRAPSGRPAPADKPLTYYCVDVLPLSDFT